MKIYRDIIQSSPEWHEIKYGKVGGSSAKDLNANESKPIRGNAIYDKILAAKFEEFFPEENISTFAMDRGVELEPYARAEFERIYNVKVSQVGWIELDNGLIGISPDGLVCDESQITETELINVEESIEIKCPSAAIHMKYIRNNDAFIETYIDQLVHNFLVLGVKRVRCISFRQENTACPLLEFMVTPDTLVKVSAKKTCSIRELVAQSEARCNELIACIKEDVEKYTIKQQLF